MKKIYRMFFGRQWSSVMKILIGSIYVYLFFYFLMIFFISDSLFGANRLTFDSVLTATDLFFFNAAWVRIANSLFLSKALLIFSSIVVLINFKLKKFSLHLLITILYFSITKLTYPLRDGGLAMLDLFMIVSTPWFLIFNDKNILWRHIFANFAFLILRIHLIGMYLGAVLLKISSPFWQRGVALYYILRPDDWSTALSSYLATNSMLFVVVGTYGIIIFQLAYPFFLSHKKLKLSAILTMMFFHLSTALLMRLYYFGTIMVIFNIAFLSDKELACLKRNILKCFSFFYLPLRGRLHILELPLSNRTT